MIVDSPSKPKLLNKMSSKDDISIRSRSLKKLEQTSTDRSRKNTPEDDSRGFPKLKKEMNSQNIDIVRK